MATTSRENEKSPVEPDDAYRVKSDGTVAVDTEFTEKEQKLIVRRIDRRLVVTVGIMYCVSLMDRTNLGSANIAGMETELNLVGTRYVSLARACHYFVSRGRQNNGALC